MDLLQACVYQIQIPSEDEASPQHPPTILRQMRACLRFLFVLSSLAFFCPTSTAQVDLNQMVTFGDSLTHNDLLGLVTGKPQSMYGNDPNQAFFEKAKQPGDDLDSYAVGGSETGDILTQIGLYDFFRLLGVQDAGTLFGIQAGGNDILNNIGLLATHPPGNEPAADKIIDDAIENLREAVLELADRPGVDFIVWTIPDVTLTPEHFGQFTATEAQNVRAHVERANVLIRAAANKSQVAVFDLFTFLDNTVANPPVLFGQQLVGPPAFCGFDYLFGDEIHPTSVHNALMANSIIASVNAKWGLNIPVYDDCELADLAQIPH